MTGAARGMGRKYVETFAREGCRVVMTDVDADQLAEAAAEISGPGLEIHQYVHDITDSDACFALALKVRDEVGNVDILVNNAGVVVGGDFTSLTEREIRRMTEVNYFGQVWMMQAFLPDMLNAKKGRIVNISSTAGKMGVSKLGAYCATKFALQGLTDGLRDEYKKSGVAFTIVNPGYVKTGMFEGSRVPIITRWYEPQEVVDAVLRGIKHNYAEVCMPNLVIKMASIARGLCIPRVTDGIMRLFGEHKSFENLKGDTGRPF